MRDFASIWGVDSSTAIKWYSKGFRSVHDVLRHSRDLTLKQRLGLKYHSDFSLPIPSSEIAAVVDAVHFSAATSGFVKQGFRVTPAGAFRRGHAHAAEAVLVLASDTRLSLRALVRALHEQHLLHEDYVLREDEGGEQLYVGVMKLDERFRRITIVAVVGESHEACALLHYTGNDTFLRSMREKARYLNYSLKRLSMHPVKCKHGKTFWEGESLPISSERDIFKTLRVPYLPPTHRDA
mmetsp:Transcript_6493/g.15750  ORF Transcript_6493/g.15750 Transcript_6493/m.15750 type:complete len:238 (-) Transcript_6493:33-746(-)